MCLLFGALLLDFNRFCSWVKKFITKDGMIEIAGRQLHFALGGDKGYYNVAPLGKTVVVLTETAAGQSLADEDDDDAAENGKARRRGRNKRQMMENFLQSHEHCVLDPFFASHRSVVERTIGWLKAKVPFVDGPLNISQADALAGALVVVCALHNKEMHKNPQLHVSAPADGDGDAANDDQALANLAVAGDD
jgi:hypothetical protein